MRWFWQKPKQDHVSDYLLLLLLLAFSLMVSRLYYLGNLGILMLTIGLSVAYVVWGIMHHKKSGYIDKKIVLEYVSLAILVVVIVATLSW